MTDRCTSKDRGCPELEKETKDPVSSDEAVPEPFVSPFRDFHRRAQQGWDEWYKPDKPPAKDRNEKRH